MNFSSMKVRTKLTLAFGSLVVLLLLVALLAWSALRHGNDAFDHFAEGVTARSQVASAVRQAVDARAVAARNLVLVSRPEDIEQERAKVEKAHQAGTRELARLLEMAKGEDVSDKARGLIAEIARVEQLYAPVALDIVALATQGKRDEAIQKMNEKCRPLLAELVRATDAFTEYTRSQTQQMIAEADKRMSGDMSLFSMVVLVAVVVGVVSGVLIVKGLLRALGAEPSELGAAESRSRIPPG